MTLDSWISGWKEKYCPGVEISIAYGALRGNYLGMTHYVRSGQQWNSAITVNVIFEEDTFTSYVIAWHEFCHAWSRYENAEDDHGVKWASRWIRKPLLTIPAYLIILPNVIRRMATV